MARLLRPDVVVMDLRMPGMGGAEATAHILREVPGTRVLILTTYDTDADILVAVEAGATGYLLKDAPRTRLADAVRAVAAGETVIAEPVAARLVSRLREPARPKLTQRELEVLALVAEGRSNPEIARELFIGEATVKTHLLRLFAKLGVDDRTRAVTLAYETGILTRPQGAAGSPQARGAPRGNCRSPPLDSSSPPAVPRSSARRAAPDHRDRAQRLHR
jgi:DNA-binding NarL/FixJ family response regulator